MKKDTKKASRPHKYRVSLYLGKDLFATISGMAQFMGIPVATACKILLETGVQIGNALDKKGVESLKKYGESKM